MSVVRLAAGKGRPLLVAAVEHCDPTIGTCIVFENAGLLCQANRKIPMQVLFQAAEYQARESP